MRRHIRDRSRNSTQNIYLFTYYDLLIEAVDLNLLLMLCIQRKLKSFSNGFLLQEGYAIKEYTRYVCILLITQSIN